VGGSIVLGGKDIQEASEKFKGQCHEMNNFLLKVLKMGDG
jgi:hypothetical protein